MEYFCHHDMQNETATGEVASVRGDISARSCCQIAKCYQVRIAMCLRTCPPVTTTTRQPSADQCTQLNSQQNQINSTSSSINGSVNHTASSSLSSSSMEQSFIFHHGRSENPSSMARLPCALPRDLQPCNEASFRKEASFRRSRSPCKGSDSDSFRKSRSSSDSFRSSKGGDSDRSCKSRGRDLGSCRVSRSSDSECDDDENDKRMNGGMNGRVDLLGATRPSEASSDMHPRWKARSNSTESVYTLKNSCDEEYIDELAFATSCYLHDRIIAGEAHVRKLWFEGKAPPPHFHAPGKPTEESIQEGVSLRLPRPPLLPSWEPEPNAPDEDTIYDFLRPLQRATCFSAECLIVSLIYIERLFVKGGIPPLLTNWKAVIFTAIVIAAKVWDDTGSTNGEFSFQSDGLCTNKQLNEMEARFLSLIDYNVKVGRKLYAATFFELRAMCDTGDGSDSPAHPRGVLDKQRQEIFTSMQQKWRRRANSTLDITNSPRMRHL
mmetsp:Transcript_7259/g.12281  ORF Transcript_7259/g.12281 Transcript_7259/m.12281 type:complete len:493 (+) Transcript_7259:164-1642(+)